MLYRLYLLWQRERRRVVIIDGGAKLNSTALPDSFYDELAALAATAEDSPAPLRSLMISPATRSRPAIKTRPGEEV